MDIPAAYGSIKINNAKMSCPNRRNKQMTNVPNQIEAATTIILDNMFLKSKNTENRNDMLESPRPNQNQMF